MTSFSRLQDNTIETDKFVSLIHLNVKLENNCKKLASVQFSELCLVGGVNDSPNSQTFLQILPLI